ncbi:MAG: class I SAM-dependent methyltransferase [Candidatus Hydrogenedentes bacterium]|nr:class I SAM-dependent methyltransferase [Candidatus Hydrogenedentota bacterium]
MSGQEPVQSLTNVAAYYDVLAGGRKRLDREGPLLTECLRRAPGRCVVDLACGTGLHALFMAESGAEVTALDTSAGMIAYARANRPHPSVAYGVGDMRRLGGGPWDLALCLGNSLSLLPSVEDLSSVFQGVASALRPGGLFLMQLLNYSAPSAQEPRHRVERHRVAGEDLVVVKSLVPDDGRTLLSIVFHIADKSHTAPRSMIESHIRAIVDTAVLRHWSSVNLREAAEAAGLCVTDEYGAFGRAPFEPSSSDLIVVAAKPRVADAAPTRRRSAAWQRQQVQARVRGSDPFQTPPANSNARPNRGDSTSSNRLRR